MPNPPSYIKAMCKAKKETDDFDWSGKFKINDHQSIYFDQKTKEVKEMQYSPYVLDFQRGKNNNSYIVRNSKNEVKLIGKTSQSNPNTLMLVDIDDQGFLQFKASKIDSQGNIVEFIGSQIELLGECDKMNDVNCPGNSLVASFSATRLA